MANIIYGLTISLLYGVIGAGQLLGFAAQYRAGLAFPLAGMLTLLAAWIFFGEARRPDSTNRPLQDENQPAALKPLNAALWLAALALLALLVAVPLLNWPASPIGRSLTWDAGAYHFPKAVELFRSGSVWDLSVPYGDYPFGYESLLAFCLLLSGDERLFGLVHLLAALLFWLALYRLGRRYSGLPCGMLALFSALVLAGGTLVSSDRTWLISGYALTVGKNDFLLGALSLALIAHAPVGCSGDRRFDLLTFSMLTMAALSVKPNALGVAAPLGLYIILLVWRAANAPTLGGRVREAARTLAPAALLALPGGLWILRNLAVLGVIFTPAAAHLQADSILSNINNVYLYSLNFYFLLLCAVSGLALFSLLAVGAAQRLPAAWRSGALGSLSIALALLLLLAAFTATPATAFHRVRDVPSHIAWRFGVALLAYAALLALLYAEPLLLAAWRYLSYRPPVLRRAALGLAVLLTALLLWRGRWITATEPQNAWILRDHFSSPVGVNGYASATDYVKKNIRHSAVWVENALLYYYYGPGYTNTPTKLQYPLEMSDRVHQPDPQYFVILRPDWQGSDPDAGVFPPSLTQPAWLERWRLIYDDGQGRVYQKR